MLLMLDAVKAHRREGASVPALLSIRPPAEAATSLQGCASMASETWGHCATVHEVPIALAMLHLYIISLL